MKEIIVYNHKILHSLYYKDYIKNFLTENNIDVFEVNKNTLTTNNVKIIFKVNYNMKEYLKVVCDWDFDNELESVTLSDFLLKIERVNKEYDMFDSSKK